MSGTRKQVKHPVHGDLHADDTGERTRLVGIDQDRDITAGMGDDSDLRKLTAMDMVVFLRDRTGIYMSLEDGQEAETSDLMEIVLQEQGLPPECERIFSLWLVSPLLELRLKKHHRPFSLVQQWDALCATYTDAKVEDIQRDEPVLMFQRNVFFPKELEKQETNEQILCLLYHEAKFNVIEGRYLLTADEYHNLAAIQALIHLKHFDAKDHLLPQYRSNLHQFYPEHMCRKPVHLTDMLSVFNKNKAPKETCEEVFMARHQEISEKYDGEDVDKLLGRLYKAYLKICWQLPCYGSAFFQSDTPRAGVRLQFLRSPSYIHTWTAINTEGVCVIDQEKDEILLAVPFTELSWQLKDSESDEDTPCLYLQFLVHDESQGEVTKLLQVYSRQGRMMDALIESCVKQKLLERQNSATTGHGHLDFADGPSDADDYHKVTKRLDKLALSTYSTKGEKID